MTQKRTRVLVTGSTQGIGRETVRQLQAAGHEAVVHARTEDRLAALADLIDAGATAVVGDLADPTQVRALAERVDALGGVEAIVHNAGVMNGPDIAAVNVLAPYELTALLPAATRHVYLSSGMHRGGRAVVPEPFGPEVRITYSDSKLLVTALALGLARTDPTRRYNAVDPGWVPTRMGGRSAPDDLQAGAATQVWLATAPDADRSGAYWFHRRQQTPQRSAADPAFQDRLLEALARATGNRAGHPDGGAGNP